MVKRPGPRKAPAVRAQYVPERGDLIWLDFDPQAGHEQAGRRPALVLSPRRYNASARLAVCCPITSRVKGYPFEVALSTRGAITGVVLSDQLRSLDWSVRRAERAGRASTEVLGEVIAKVRALVD